MNRLHILNKGQREASAATDLLGALESGDTVLLIENAVVLAAEGSPYADQVSRLNGVQLVALREDCALRGVTASCDTTDYAGFVALTAACKQSISWF